MSFEDFSGDFSPEYPADYVEIPTPESVQRPEQSTLKALLDALEDKTRDGQTSQWGLQRSASLYAEGENMTADVSWLRPDITAEKSTNDVGWVTLKQPVGNDGDYVRTTYKITDTLDELHIEKRVLMETKQSHPIEYRHQEYSFISPSGLEEVMTPMDNRAIEDELGLSSVSEQEARDLRAYLDRAQPLPSVAA